jgi:hypothetical protein
MVLAAGDCQSIHQHDATKNLGWKNLLATKNVGRKKLLPTKNLARKSFCSTKNLARENFLLKKEFCQCTGLCMAVSGLLLLLMCDTSCVGSPIAQRDFLALLECQLLTAT